MLYSGAMIIGITGPAGAGKDTAAHYVAEHLKFPHVSGGDILREMLLATGLEPKKAALGPFGVFIRTQYGGDEVVRRVLDKANGAKNVVYSGFRSPAEARAVKDRGGVLLYIDASDELRHARIGNRGRNGDATAKHELVALDKQESTAGASENENLPAVKAMADTIIVNESTIEAFRRQLDDFCRPYLV